MNPTIKTGILATLTGVLVAIIIGTGSGFTNLAAAPHQLPSSSSKRLTSAQEKSAAVSISFELDNPLIEIDEGIVPARKCAVCIGVGDTLRLEFVSLVQKMMCYFFSSVIMMDCCALRVDIITSSLVINEMTQISA